MKLLTKELIERFKQQGDTSRKEAKDIKVIAKFFNPCGAGTWFATDYDEKNQIFFGYANLGDDRFAELGSFGLKELQEYRSPFMTGIERDLHFGEHTLQEVLDTKGHL